MGGGRPGRGVGAALAFVVLVCALRPCLAAPFTSLVAASALLPPSSGPAFSRWRVIEGGAGGKGAFGGIAALDVNRDNRLELFLNGQHEANRVLAWRDGALVDIAPDVGLADNVDGGHTKIGHAVAVCDVDGDGAEDIYAVASSEAPGNRKLTDVYGSKVFNDRLFRRDPHSHRFTDTIAYHSNQANNLRSSASAACVDMVGRGTYSVFLGELGGGLREFKNDNYSVVIPPPPPPVLRAGHLPPPLPFLPPLSIPSLVAAPLLHPIPASAPSSPFSVPTTSPLTPELYVLNSAGHNYLLSQRAQLSQSAPAAATQGAWHDIAKGQVADELGLARDVAVLDFDGDGMLDLLVVNDMPVSEFSARIKQDDELPTHSRHHVFRNKGNGHFEDMTPAGLHSHWSRARGVVVADFDNDGQEEIFIHNAATSTTTAPNFLLKRVGGVWREVDIGEAADEHGVAAAAMAVDIDGDGKLELVLTHHHTQPSPPLVFRPRVPANAHYLRIVPLTERGAVARGALVVCVDVCGNRQVRVVDAGGRPGSVEPVAHFGLGKYTAVLYVRIIWPDGHTHTLLNPDVDRTYRVDKSQGHTTDDTRGNAHRWSDDECAGRAPVAQPSVAHGSRGATSAQAPPTNLVKVECYNGRGEEYDGEVSVTMNGFRCQDWGSMSPNFHIFWPSTYPSLVANNCRNPGTEQEPWCYTVDGPRWEVCGLPNCADLGVDENGMVDPNSPAYQAAQCRRAPSCSSYPLSPCPPVVESPCLPGFLPSVSQCSCFRGVQVSCDDPAPQCHAGFQFVKTEGTAHDPARCLCVHASVNPEHLHDGPVRLPDGSRNASDIALRHRAAFRACLASHPVGPLRCVALMESLGYPFSVYADASFPNGPLSGDRGRAGANDDDNEGEGEGEGHGLQRREDTEVDPCPSVAEHEDVCENGDKLVRELGRDGKERCLCRQTSFELSPCPANDPKACGAGYEVEMLDGDKEGSCLCTLAAKDESRDLGDLDLDGAMWHGGCDHCHYGNGECHYSHDKGWYCRCVDPNYRGDDCLHD